MDFNNIKFEDNLNSIEKYTPNHLSQAIDIFVQNEEDKESKCRKVGRIIFQAGGIVLSYATLIPSLLTANQFKPFPGASQISSAAVMINFGTFGADNYIELGNIVFNSKKEKITCSKIMKIIVSTICGGAGITLKIAPGIPSKLRPPLAILNVLGTCSPETLSMYNTLGMNIQKTRQCCKKDLRLESLHCIRENLLKCLLGVKERILQMSPQEREKELSKAAQELLLLKSRPIYAVAIKTIFDCFITKNNHQKAVKIEEIHRSRKWIKLGIGTLTSLGSVCSLIQGTLLSKQTFDYLIPSAPLWTWVPSILSSMTIAHTTFDSSYKAAYRTFDLFSGLWNNKQTHSLSSSLYPKTDVAMHLLAIFWSLALFGILYESAAGQCGAL